MASLVRKSAFSLMVTGRRIAVGSSPRAVSMLASPSQRSLENVGKNGLQVQQNASRFLSMSSPRMAEAQAAAEPDIPVVPVEIVEQFIKAPILLDVRKPEEVTEYGKIPKAYVLPVDDIEDALKLPDEAFRAKYNFDKPSPDSLLIVYCRSGKRADRAGKIFRDKFGYKKVVNYKGSWGEWANLHPEHVKAQLPK